MSKSRFAFACIVTMDEQLCRTLALWAGLHLAEEIDACATSVHALQLATVYRVGGKRFNIDAATQLVWDSGVPTGIRSAILAQTLPNYRLHAFHSVSELARVLGWHLVSNTVADILETQELRIA